MVEEPEHVAPRDEADILPVEVGGPVNVAVDNRIDEHLSDERYTPDPFGGGNGSEVGACAVPSDDEVETRTDEVGSPPAYPVETIDDVFKAARKGMLRSQTVLGQ